MDPSDLQRHLDQIMDEQNRRPIAEFEGYSPHEMHQILHFPLDPQSPLSLQQLSDDEYDKIPILNLIKYLISLIRESGAIKLTAKGYLPTRMVKDIYNQGFMKEYSFESGLAKLYKEMDSLSVNMTRLLAEASGLTKKRKGKLSLTKYGETISADNHKLFAQLFQTMTAKFNWAYYDHFQNEQIGPFGYGFSLILLAKYGKTKRLDSFYAQKYFKAFPRFLDFIEPTYGTTERYAAYCYSLRTFERFMHYFGLVNLEKQGKFLERQTFVSKTDIFDRLINIRNPAHSSNP